MMKHYPSARTLEVTIDGKLIPEDYTRLIPLMEDLIERHKKLDLLVVLRDFDGWMGGARWDDVAPSSKRFDNVAKLAIVGDKASEAGLANFRKPFAKAETRFFSSKSLAAARGWVGLA